MIPKKIHYCWLSNDKMSDIAKKCIATWRKVLPDYELFLWNASNFDINSIKFVKQAFEMRKWACAADYIRLYAVYNEGGIYLDTDVYVLKNFNDLLGYDYFSSLERDLTTIPPDSEYFQNYKNNENFEPQNTDIQRIEGFGLQAAIFGGKAGNAFIKDCMSWYENNDFLLPNGKPIISTGLIAPDIYASIMQNYGFKYKSGLQKLNNNMLILPADNFPNHLYKTDNAYAVHICENSWNMIKKKNNNNLLADFIKRNNVLRKILGKKPYYSWEKIINTGGEYKL